MAADHAGAASELEQPRLEELEALAQARGLAPELVRARRLGAVVQHQGKLVPRQLPVDPEHEERLILGRQGFAQGTEARSSLGAQVREGPAADLLDQRWQRRDRGQRLLPSVEAPPVAAVVERGVAREAIRPGAKRAVAPEPGQIAPEPLAEAREHLGAVLCVAVEGHQEAVDLRAIAADGQCCSTRLVPLIEAVPDLSLQRLTLRHHPLPLGIPRVWVDANV
jgi:hypothetical protein